MHNLNELKRFIGCESGAKRLFPVKTTDVTQAELELGFELPATLKDFYIQIGYGWLGPKSRSDVSNLIVHPLDLVDLHKGESEFSPPEGFIEGDLPVFHCGGYRFLVMRPNSGSQTIYYDDGSSRVIAENFTDLICNLANHPTFYECI
ncbi:SMI1/KNR4 family protein [Chitinimonas viridis]|uniref:SMI1/KNR4 family protein n=1 Tax=Chitinimonas viridis TaxID=664880 RepID=A0ABT8B6S5_9NEIS|nr:SMI1/KNR4 family protein [Chitinimonas viridis]MDN3577967.1 SMI1/KNR4 family protein [Chitinimonas viridis]